MRVGSYTSCRHISPTRRSLLSSSFHDALLYGFPVLSDGGEGEGAVASDEHFSSSILYVTLVFVFDIFYSSRSFHICFMCHFSHMFYLTMSVRKCWALPKVRCTNNSLYKNSSCVSCQLYRKKHRKPK